MEGTKYMEDQIISSNNQSEESQIDSDLEEDTLEAKKSGFDMVIEFEADKVPNGAKVVLCSGGCSKALARIMFDDNLESIGSVKVTAKEQPNEPKPKEKEVLEIKLN